jgi:hypothetical protein
MAYFPDLSPYSYFQPACSAENVGWLDDGHKFAVAPPTDEFLDALWQFVVSPVAQTRGVHECELCPRDPDYWERRRELHRRMRDPGDPLHHTPLGEIPWPDDARSRALEANHRGEQRLIGSAEIRAFGSDGKIYAAPTLIFHYVAVHHYNPPMEFVRAVLNGPGPKSDEYRALLKRHEIW